MNLRERTEQWEIDNLSPYASKSAESRGRKRPVDKCDIRTEFQRDRDKITHSKAFRRLMHKTQVFISPEGDHFRTRLTHTLEVAQIARTISRALRLNEDLTEAIALGHDLGHTPFGHTGEDALNRINPGGFEHNKQGIRVVERIEKGGNGLNLTYEVLDGILNHRTCCNPATLEGKVVQLSDKIAYINHDVDDALRASMLKPTDLPIQCLNVLGNNTSDRINVLIRSVISASLDKDNIVMEPEAKDSMDRLRTYMFDTIYLSQINTKERKKIFNMLNRLYLHYLEHIGDLGGEFARLLNEGETPEQTACDYIACMTDRFAVREFNRLFIPITFSVY